MAPKSKDKTQNPGTLLGRERWEVRVEEGSPHGGLYEYEQETFFHVIDRRSGTTVKTFTGHCTAAFDGSGNWGDGHSGGVRQVVIDEEGRCAFAIHDDRMVERFPLTDDSVPDDPSLPWRIAGRPLPPLPMTVDGFVVDDAVDFEALATRVAGGWLPDGAAYPIPVTWLCDLYLRLNGLPASSLLAGIFTRWAGSRDESQRGAALCFYRRIPHAAGRESVLAAVVASGIAEAVRPSPVKYGDGHLDYAPMDVFAAMIDTDTLDPHGHAVLAACGDFLQVPTTYFKREHTAGVGRHDPAWLASNAPAVVLACPERLGSLLGDLDGYGAYREGLLLSAVRALEATPGLGPEAVAAGLRSVGLSLPKTSSVQGRD